MKFNFEKYEDHKTFDRLYPLVKILKKFVYKTEITGQENIPEKDGYIVICNHIHAVDPGVIEYAFGGKPIHFMGKSEFWDNAFIGPNVTIATPMHPLLPEERNIRTREDGSSYNLEYGRPVTIEKNCWISANVVICGGVTVGEGTVIGAGSVVTRDIPPHSLAAGSPCRVIREITEADRQERPGK